VIATTHRGGRRHDGPHGRSGPVLLRAAGAIAVTVVFAAPVLLLVSGSLRPPGLPPLPRPELIPDTVSLDSYRRAIELGDLTRATANSALVATLTTIGSVLVASLAGFALARLKPAHARPLLAASVVALMVPPLVLLVPRFAVFRALGLTDTLVPLIAPALLATSPLYVLAYYVAFRRVSPDLYDACRLVDLSSLATWWRVGLPLVRPFTAAVAALCFITSWTNLFDPLVYIYQRDLYTVPLALRSLATLDPVNYPVFLAGAVLVTIPVIAAFLVVQPVLVGQRADREGSDSTWFVR
jgi:multiple sugar transport system permease protein